MKMRWARLAWGLALVAGCRMPRVSDHAAASATREDIARAARLESAAAAAVGTAGQEYVNFLHTDWRRMAIQIMKGEQGASPEQLAQARETVAWFTELLEQAPSWPSPGTVVIPRTPTPPQIDGRLDDPAWERAVTFEGAYPFNSREYSDEPATTWKVLWDESFLYFSFACADPDIQAPDMPRDSAVFSYDCVEMFLLPDPRLGVYWEIIVSPTGSLYDGLHAKKFQDWGPLSRAEENCEGLLTGCQVAGTPDQPGDRDSGYTVEVAVPFRQLPSYTRGNLPVSGDRIHLMLVRLDKNADAPLVPLAFRPLLSWGHNIWNHAEGVLGE